jgi:peptidoglycan hydrolase-like protein with peptidoglycan-binding domain
MHGGPLFLVGLGALGAWLLFKPKTANAKVSAEAGMPSAVPPKKMNISSTPTKTPTLEDSPSASTGNYLQHLTNAADKVMRIQKGADTHEESLEVNQAYDDLSAPMDVLTVQKDLNVLGASPALVEDGVYGTKTKDAIDSFQNAMGIDRTGQMNPMTNNALRRAVVAVTSQGAIS